MAPAKLAGIISRTQYPRQFGGAPPWLPVRA